MIVEFSIVPVGTGTSLSRYVAESVRIVKESGLSHQLTPMGTVIEGEAGEVMPVVMACHEKIMQMCDRAITSIKIDDRRDRKVRMEDKVRSVESKLKG